VEWDQSGFEVLLRKMGKKRIEGARAVSMLEVFKIQTSCGYGVPRLSSTVPNDPEKPGEAAFEDHETMGHWASDNVGRMN